MLDDPALSDGLFESIVVMTVQRVAPGVFFSPSNTLPRGRHALARQDLQGAQRERLMAAFTELVASRGLSTVTVADIVARAGVSRSAFYACFEDLSGCADSAYERFIAVLLNRLTAAIDPDADWPAFIASVITGYLGALQDDLVVARAMQIEMDAAGRPARTRRRAALSLLAAAIENRYTTLRASDPTLRPLPTEAYLGYVYAVRQLACDALEDEPDPNLLALLGPIVQWVTAGVTTETHVQTD